MYKQWAQFGDLVINLNHVTRFRFNKRQGEPGYVELRFADGSIETLDGDDARRLWHYLEMCCGTRATPQGDSLGNYVSEPLSRGLS